MKVIEHLFISEERLIANRRMNDQIPELKFNPMFELGKQYLEYGPFDGWLHSDAIPRLRTEFHRDHCLRVANFVDDDNDDNYDNNNDDDDEIINFHFPISTYHDHN